MELKIILFLLSDLILILSGYIYGWKFLRKRNYLLGLEWWIVGFSASNLFAFALIGAKVGYNISMFLDAFSRAFGFPVIAVVGTMAITHRFRPSTLADIVIFALSFAGAFVLMYVDAVQPSKPWFYLLMFAVFLVYAVNMIMRLLRAGERPNALNLLLVLVTSGAIAVMDDFYRLPGDDADKTLFFTIAMVVWAYLLIGYYYAYCASERAEHS
jgi:cation transport ATPase